MSDLHAAASTPKGRELVEVVLAEFDRWKEHAASQGAGVWPHSPEEAARTALRSVRADLADHLIIPIGVTLAAWEGVKP